MRKLAILCAVPLPAVAALVSGCQSIGLSSARIAKVDAGLAHILTVYEQGSARPGSDQERIIADAERLGGLHISIQCDHELIEAELSSLEQEHSVRFIDRDAGGTVAHPSAGGGYQALVPLDRIRGLAAVSYVANLSTSLWPPADATGHECCL